MPSSLTFVDCFTTSLLALITAVLALIASRFLFSTVVSEHAVLLRDTSRMSRTAAGVMASTLHPSDLKRFQFQTQRPEWWSKVDAVAHGSACALPCVDIVSDRTRRSAGKALVDARFDKIPSF